MALEIVRLAELASRSRCCAGWAESTGRAAGDHSAEWVNVLVHYAMMIALGGGIFPAFRPVYGWARRLVPPNA